MNLRFDIEQGTPEWHEIKYGKFSASVADNLLMGENTAGYNSLISRIVEERFTGRKTDGKSFSNGYMERGIEMEEEAVEYYEALHLCSTQKIGVIEVDDWVVVSPDRLIGDDGLLQIKCPIFNTQVGYLKSGKVPNNYFKQMQFELWASQRDYNVFFSYHPDLPPLEVVVEPDKKVFELIESRLEKAKEQVVADCEFLSNLMLKYVST
jgi:exodeoxyribonuclease (lambda-induced)